MKNNFYITTTLPYVNAEPHVGFATEFIRADVIARYKKLIGSKVFFNTGTDEHGQKLFEAAQKEGKDVQQYVNEYAEKFRGLSVVLGITPDVHFVRTTDERHVVAAQAFWKQVKDNGYIYKKSYQTKYCVGCEENKTDSELVDGKCPIHNNRELEIIEEENYFFAYSKFQEKLLAYYDENPNFIIPASRMNEARSFIEQGLHDFSISRLAAKMSWGIPVPDDAEHVMYVWFDALTNYISTLGWPEEGGDFKNFWKNGITVQYCGKDNTRFQGIMWQAMLMAAQIPNTHTVVVDGFITGEGGVKMSKSLGNVINPYDVVHQYGTDALRYFVLREVHPFEDSPFTMERFKESYNSGLANGLGNLVSRIMKMAVSYGVDLTTEEKEMSYYGEISEQKYLDTYDIKAFMDEIWNEIQELDKYIQVNEPFKKIKVDEAEGKKDVHHLLYHLFGIALKLEPLLPETSEKIKSLIRANATPEAPLFVRKD